MGTKGRLAFALSLAAAAAAVGAGTASAQVISATSTSTPEFVVFPTTDSAEFRLQLTTGASVASPKVSFLVPAFGHGRAGFTLALDDPTLEGPGQLGRDRFHIDPFGFPCVRGFRTRRANALLEIPANSTTTLVVPATLASEPPWDDTSYRLGFEVSQPDLAPMTVYPSGPVARGPRGVRISLYLDRREPVSGLVEVPPTVKGPTKIRVFGGTRPRLRNRLITLNFDNSTRRQPILRRVRTDDQGNYSYMWRPGRRRYVGVVASFTPSTGGSRAPDESCPRSLQID